jgi:hypothetical protein
MTLHVEEPAKVSRWTAAKVHEFATLASKIASTQAEEMKALAKSEDQTVRLNLIPPMENLAMTRQKLESLFKAEQERADKGRAAFWKSMKAASFLQGKTTASDISRVANLVNGLKSDIATGGDAAGRSLSELINLVGTSGASDTMRYSGVLQRAASVLESESASDHAKGLAGSLITLLTDMPVSSETSDIASGGNGHVTIVLPSPQRIYGHA